MNFPEGLFSDAWAFGAFVPVLLVWLWCARTAPWRRLADPRQLNVWLGAVVVLMLLWSMSAGVSPGLNLHLLGATAFTLMFGSQLAIAGFSAVLAAVTLNGAAGWDMYALNLLAMAVLPCLLAHGLLRLVERFLPANFFCYIFFAVFFGAAVAVAATGLYSSLLLWWAAIYPADALLGSYLPYYVLLGFAEAWLNGAVMTLMVVYCPHWVASFDDRRYLYRHRQ